MKKIRIALCSILFVCALSFAILPMTACNTAEAMYGRGSVVIEATSRRVLVGENKDGKLYPASTTKVLTALVVLDTLPLQLVVTIPNAAVGIEGSSIYLKAGEKLTVEELLFGLMLQSGNDSAVALAIAAGGSVEAFANLMNKKAEQCGAKNSHFVSPHGLHSDDHFTTAYDLALITAKAFENEDFVRIVSTKQKAISNVPGKRYLANKNKLLTMFEGANGVKTGYTKKSGRCLVGAAKQNGMQLISVVFNFNDMWNDSIRMLKYGFDTYEMYPLENVEMQNKVGKKIVIDAHFDKSGNICPKSYPLNKNGSEYIEFSI